jgi:hypothetical protein
MVLPQDFRELLAEFERDAVSFVLIGGGRKSAGRALHATRFGRRKRRTSGRFRDVLRRVGGPAPYCQYEQLTDRKLCEVRLESCGIAAIADQFGLRGNCLPARASATAKS